MSENSVFFLAVGIGIVAGLRALTAPAAVSWAARLGWLNPHDSLSVSYSKDISLLDERSSNSNSNFLLTSSPFINWHPFVDVNNLLPLTSSSGPASPGLPPFSLDVSPSACRRSSPVAF
jgi:hypothetical protein